MINIVAFTDGSCHISKHSTYAGYGIFFVNGEFEDVAEPFLIKKISNNRAELYAIYICIKIITDSGMKFDTIQIYTDSIYSLKSVIIWVESWIKNGWKTANKKIVKNKDIIYPIYKLLQKHKDKIKFFHVKAHTKNTGYLSINNARADILANQGAQKCLQILLKLKKNT